MPADATMELGMDPNSLGDLNVMVDVAVERVLLLHSLPELMLQLHQARCEVAALQDVQDIDTREIRRLLAIIASLESKSTEQQRQQDHGSTQPQQLEAANTDAQVAVAVPASPAQPFKMQQLEQTASRLRQQLDANTTDMAALQRKSQEEGSAAQAALRDARELAAAARAQAAAAEQRARDAEAKREAAEAASRALQQQQQRHQQQPAPKGAVLPGAGAERHSTRQGDLRPAPGPLPAEAAPTSLTKQGPAAAVLAVLPEMLQSLRQQFEASMRQEVSQLRREIAAAVQLAAGQQQQQQQASSPQSQQPGLQQQALGPQPEDQQHASDVQPQGQPQQQADKQQRRPDLRKGGTTAQPLPPLEPASQHPATQQEAHPSAEQTPVRPPAVPAEAVSKARLGPADGGAATRKRAPSSPLSPSPSSSMDISNDEGGQPLSQEAPPPPPPAPVAHSLQGTQPAVRASAGQSPSMRVYQRAHMVPPGAPPQLQQQQQQQGQQQQGKQQPGQQQQKQWPQAKPRQQAAKQQPQLVGSPNAQVAAAVAAAQSLTALLDPAPAPLHRTARTQQAASQPPSTPAAAVVKQQQQQSAAPAAAAQGASLRPAAAAGQAKQINPTAGYVQARAEELPPWLALAVSVRARQRAAAEAAAAAAAAPTATAAPGVASLSKLRQWQQTAQAHADSASGTPPPTLPFAVAADTDPEEFLAQVAAGQQPYCCPPCRAVFASETEYLQHQLEPGHNEKCRSVFTFYTSNTIAQNAASIIKTSSRSDGQLTPSQRQHMFCCIACSHIMRLDQFIHHVICPGHLQKCEVQLAAISNKNKRQRKA
ncbi:hypothetical protein D9Q98_002234 [Chlorella vulgaris]|uniref:C2H2-type domain-containing protein n=1 Tax=Chlorella vulgaris TaxID=3077 RepID=A0A9D4TVV7_CHLVU|nr:hypothetical protein D9Q98_002234 [Chlorella vulgaris]